MFEFKTRNYEKLRGPRQKSLKKIIFEGGFKIMKWFINGALSHLRPPPRQKALKLMIVLKL